MKKINIWVLLLALCTFSACVKDESTEAIKPISEITIVEGSMQSVYNVHALDTLTIVPQVVQSNRQKPLTYTWEIDLEVFATGDSLVYIARQLGSYNCRLIVENEDGKTFFPFKLNVNSSYEEGLTVISNDAAGNSCLSFMLTPTDGSEKKFYIGDCFAPNNTDIRLASNVADVLQCDKNLILVCQGAGTGGDVPTIYFLNDKTFVVENMVEVTEYPDFKPVRLAMPAASSFGTTYPVLCENGRIYDFSSFEYVVEKPVKLTSVYANSCVVNTTVGSNYYDFLFWDKEVGGLAEIYSGYGPYYCSKKYHATRDDMAVDSLNYFAKKDFVTMTLIHQTPQQLTNNGGISEMIVLAKSGVMVNKVVICPSYHVYDYDTGSRVLYDNGGMKLCSFAGAPLDETTPCIANKTYYSMLFAKGNKVMKWYYASSTFITDAKELLAVGSDNAVITSFELSADHTKTYVSFYEPDQPGMNGSVWVFDTDKGTVLEQYNNVCYKPVKMIYKRK